jgi:hypothetical protein
MASAFKLTLAALLVGSVLAALLGPPPRRRAAMRLRGSVLATGMAGYAIAAVALTAGSILAGVLALAAAGELVCAACWLGRGDSPPTDEDDGGGGGGGGGGRGPKPPPSDWDAFEQAFRRYARERDRQPV